MTQPKLHVESLTDLLLAREHSSNGLWVGEKKRRRVSNSPQRLEGCAGASFASDGVTVRRRNACDLLLTRTMNLVKLTSSKHQPIYMQSCNHAKLETVGVSKVNTPGQ